MTPIGSGIIGRLFLHRSIETTEFIRWLSQDARHAEVFSELNDTWQGFNRLGALRPAGMAAPDVDLLAPRHRARPRHRWIYAALAAAAAIALVALVQPWRAPSPGEAMTA